MPITKEIAKDISLERGIYVKYAKSNELLGFKLPSHFYLETPYLKHVP